MMRPLLPARAPHALVALMLMLSQNLVDGFPDGAPYSTCYTRYPKHGVAGQTTPSPYKIVFDRPSYAPGDVIKVTIQDPTGGETFNGIQIAAFRTSGNPEEFAGEFTNFPTNNYKAFTCFGGYKNMVTHKRKFRTPSLQLEWTAPNENVGDITFKATIIEDYDKFWVDVEEKLPSSNQNAAVIVPSTYPVIVSTSMVDDIDFSSCGDSKGCFYYPIHCDGQDCIAAATFRHRPATDDYLFELHTKEGPHYISLGFSGDRYMTHDETVSCTSDSGISGIQHGWNPGYHNDRFITRFISEGQIRQVDGRVQCQFVLPRKSRAYTINQNAPAYEYTNTTFDREETWHLFLAWGTVMPDSEVMAHHKEMPAASFDKINLKDKAIFRGSAYPVLIRAHAALMMVAWILISGFVTVISRHYRDWMPRKRIFGTKVWFQVHRELAILIAILTIIGLILVFVELGPQIRSQAVAHAVVGLIVAIAVCLQLIGGFLRPGPDHKMRFYFNWGHRCLGQLSHLLAAVTMFLAYDIEFITKDMKSFGFAVLGVWLGVQILFHIVFEVLACKGMPLSANTDSDKEQSSKKSTFQSILLAVYGVFLAGLCIAALVAFMLF